MTAQSGGLANGLPVGGVLAGSLPNPSFAAPALGRSVIVVGATAFAPAVAPGNAVTWLARDSGDTAMWVVGTPTRFIAVVAGMYRFHATMQFTGVTTPRWTTQVIVNGLAVVQSEEHGDSIANPSVVWDATVTLAAGDYVEAWLSEFGGLGSKANVAAYNRASLTGVG